MRVHECRVTVEDDLYMATLTPLRDLRLLDLTAVPEEDVTEFDSLDMAVHMATEIVQCGLLSVRKTTQGNDLTAHCCHLQVIDSIGFRDWLLRLDSNQKPSG